MTEKNYSMEKPEAITIGYDLGRKRVTINVDVEKTEDGYSYTSITLPTHVWNYGAIVSALVRTKYSESEVEAIVSNSLLLMQNPSSVSEEDSEAKVSEFNEFQAWREKCKARAKELLAIGEEMGLEEMS